MPLIESMGKCTLDKAQNPLDMPSITHWSDGEQLKLGTHNDWIISYDGTTDNRLEFTGDRIAITPAYTTDAASTSAFLLAAATITLDDNRTSAYLVNLAQPTVTKAGAAKTLDLAATLYIAGSPVAGGTAVITASHSVYIAAGTSYFGDTIQVWNSAHAANDYVTLGHDATDGFITSASGIIKLIPAGADVQIWHATQAAGDYISLYHDATNAYIKSGSGIIKIAPAGADVQIWHTTEAAGDYISLYHDATDARIKSGSGIIKITPAGADLQVWHVTEAAGDYISLSHNATDAIIASGSGILKLIPAGTDVQIWHTTQAAGDYVTIYHDATNGYVGSGSGNLILAANVDIQLLDDKSIVFGTGSDWRVLYDETTDDRLEWTGNRWYQSTSFTMSAASQYGTQYDAAVNTGAGAKDLYAAHYFSAPTVTIDGAVTTAATVYIAGAPTAGTTAQSLRVQSGMSFFSGTVHVYNNPLIVSGSSFSIQTTGAQVYFSAVFITDDGIHLCCGENDGQGNRVFTFTTSGNSAIDHDHDTLQAHPSIFLHSVLSAVTDHSEYSLWRYDGLNPDAWTMETDRATINFTCRAVSAFATATGTNRNGGNYIIQPGANEAAGVGVDGSIQLNDADGGLQLKVSTGYVQFGTKTGTGDVAVDGYVSIKDLAGNIVKLATVA